MTDFFKGIPPSNMKVQSRKMTLPFAIITLMKLYWVKPLKSICALPWLIGILLRGRGAIRLVGVLLIAPGLGPR